MTMNLDEGNLELRGRERISAMRTELNGALGHLREQAVELGDPTARAMFETSAEVIAGVVRAFENYEQGDGEPQASR